MGDKWLTGGEIVNAIGPQLLLYLNLSRSPSHMRQSTLVVLYRVVGKTDLNT